MLNATSKRQWRRLFVKEWRRFRGLTQEKLAEGIGVTQGMISQLETGQSNYTGDLLGRLAEALECDPADLLIRNPLDPDAPWAIWEKLTPAQRRQAIRLLKALVEDEAA